MRIPSKEEIFAKRPASHEIGAERPHDHLQGFDARLRSSEACGMGVCVSTSAGRALIKSSTAQNKTTNLTWKCRVGGTQAAPLQPLPSAASEHQEEAQAEATCLSGMVVAP